MMFKPIQQSDLTSKDAVIFSIVVCFSYLVGLKVNKYLMILGVSPLLLVTLKSIALMLCFYVWLFYVGESYIHVFPQIHWKDGFATVSSINGLVYFAANVCFLNAIKVPYSRSHHILLYS
jgi:hypothetical protein